ncbi:DUF7255 family protein [Arsenicicoccus dermatophilus]|uniref:DUF7255 family protein n=1 Tax=Arsenicicoccus dermatophilus TaxID=1076331 RepID=UPI001F4C54E8|nr:hypothetical protein [Arsenicicoccus dermatophilus]MCH8614460.1 hypothetical protein [Arsenicicoccus dermatophilus]
MGNPGDRQNELLRLLVAAGMTETARPAWPKMQDLGDLTGALEQTYQDLGGTLPAHKAAPGGWDMALDGVLVELDEEHHFNRYRKRTLDDDWADALPWTQTYSGYCDRYQQACYKICFSPNSRTNQSTELMFGPALDPDLDAPEALPRWKQRAFYDAIRDAYAIATKTPLARLSVHDHIEGHSLDQILRGNTTCTPAALRAHVRDRTYQPSPNPTASTSRFIPPAARFTPQPRS